MDVTMTEAITSVIIALLVLLNTLIYRVVVPFIRDQAVPFVRARTTREQRELAYGIVQSAVGYAEKQGWVRDLGGAGKRHEALNWIHHEFRRAGIEFDQDEVDGWIEDAVLRLEFGLAELVEMTFEEHEDEEES